jgi:3-hydroxybutyrate dehydrogenase
MNQSEQENGVRGRVAFVTGASRGIGRAVALRLGRGGAVVHAAARSRAALDTLCEQLRQETGNEAHRAVVMDLSDRASIDAALQQLPPLDIVVNNAGIAESMPYERSDDALWERQMTINAFAVMRICRAVLPGMIDRGAGRAIIVASNAGLTGYPYSSAYCASKHAIVGWMRAVALEIAKSPVTINALCPGWVDTAMAQAAIENIAKTTGRSPEQARASLEKMSPQRRMVAPEEVAEAAAMLCHPLARSMHGQALPLDGGQLL